MKTLNLKTLNLKNKLAQFALILTITGLCAPFASAYTVYQLKQDYYAIVCADGQIFSYSGGPGGIGIVGEALCEGHGGIAGGNGGGLNVAAAPADVSTAMQSCVEGRAKKVNANSMACPTRIRVNRIEMRATSDFHSGRATGKR